MKTIGILGGLGPEATLEYYSYIVRKYYETYGDYDYPEIIIYSVSPGEYVGDAFAQPDKPAKIKAFIEKLHLAGADFVIGACNTLHVVYDEVSKDIPIPWFSIMDATAEAIKKEGLTQVGLLGTLITTKHGFYQKALARHGIETITPDEEALKKIDDIIFTDLVRAVATDEARQFVLGCIEELKQQGAQGIVLGCTELPFLIKQEHTDVRVFSTTTIHAQKALDLALED
jgi:aspartate racemase